jgi:MEDS: MEthanogen/methylotroph, DcmR Sensory domain
MPLNESRITLKGVDEIVNHLHEELQMGTHALLIYPDLMTQRRIYTEYARKQLEDNNEIVLILPYYETTDMVRLALSGNTNTDGSYNFGYSGIDVRKYERDGSLIIMDSLKGYFPVEKGGNNNNRESKSDGNLEFIPYLDVLLKQAERQGKNGVTVLSDMGSFHHYNQHGAQRLVEYEQSLPKTYEGNLKGFCLYHQKDFETRFSKKQQASLNSCHSLSIELPFFGQGR